ncbi:MAG TPA: hypothetical protein VGR48_08620 [Terriglobales bacterium]|nr:hypothetical protein [Terriglobales bacterium]
MAEKLHKSWVKFLRLLVAFAAAVWAMRASLEWIAGGAGLKQLGGWLVLLIASFALGMAVSEEVRRDGLRQH